MTPADHEGDSMKQVRVPIASLAEALREKLDRYG